MPHRVPLGALYSKQLSYPTPCLPSALFHVGFTPDSRDHVSETDETHEACDPETARETDESHANNETYRPLW